MEILNKKIIEDKLAKKNLYFGGEWLLSKFDEIFKVSKNIKVDDYMAFISKFLEDKDINELLFFPEDNWSNEKFDGSVIKFRDIEEALDFLDENISFGVYNYYITNDSMEWFLTVCHEEDIHIHGIKFN